MTGIELYHDDKKEPVSEHQLDSRCVSGPREQQLKHPPISSKVAGSAIPCLCRLSASSVLALAVVERRHWFCHVI